VTEKGPWNSFSWHFSPNFGEVQGMISFTGCLSPLTKDSTLLDNFGECFFETKCMGKLQLLFINNSGHNGSAVRYFDPALCR